MVSFRLGIDLVGLQQELKIREQGVPARILGLRLDYHPALAVIRVGVPILLPGVRVPVADSLGHVHQFAGDQGMEVGRVSRRAAAECIPDLTQGGRLVHRNPEPFGLFATSAKEHSAPMLQSWVVREFGNGGDRLLVHPGCQGLYTDVDERMHFQARAKAFADH